MHCIAVFASSSCILSCTLTSFRFNPFKCACGSVWIQCSLLHDEGAARHETQHNRKRERAQSHPATGGAQTLYRMQQSVDRVEQHFVADDVVVAENHIGVTFYLQLPLTELEGLVVGGCSVSA